MTFVNLLYSQYLNQVNETNDYGELTFSFDVFNDTLFSVGVVNDSNNSLNSWNYLSFKKYDENFNVILEKKYTDSLNLYGSFYGFEMFQESIYNCGKKSVVAEDTAFGFITKYSFDGNRIWEKNFYSNNEIVSVGYMTSNDTALFITVTTYNPSSTGELKSYLTAIDSSGNIFWDKEFVEQEQAQSISLGTDNSILLSFHYYEMADNIRTVVYKLDEYGNTIWFKKIGGMINNHYAQAVEMPNGNILAYGTSHAPSTFGDGTPRAWLVELDKNNGNVLKDTVFMFSPVHSIFGSYSDVIFKDDHFLLVASTNYDQANPAYKPNLVSINYDFSINWRFQYESHTGRDTEGFFELLDLQNGFYLMAGITYQSTPSNTNDEWFLVVDSLGCDDQWCTVGIESISQFENDDNLKIYPNPTSGRVTFQFENLEPNTEIVITDLMGKEVDRIAASNPIAEYQFSHVRNGVYMIHLVNDGIIIQTQKIVIQK